MSARNGNVGPVTVKGSFDLPALAKTDFLVIAKGSVGPIIATLGNIGEQQKGAPDAGVGRIQGASIASIDPPADGHGILGNIYLLDIKATNGGIGRVKTDGAITAAITAKGGDIRLVWAAQVIGNIRTQTVVQPGYPNGVGGNIWYVFAAKPLANTIWADWYIGEVSFSGNTTATIKAQGGAHFDPTTGTPTQQALNIEVVAAVGPFLGTVQFLFPRATPCGKDPRRVGRGRPAGTRPRDVPV